MINFNIIKILINKNLNKIWLALLMTIPPNEHKKPVTFTHSLKSSYVKLDYNVTLGIAVINCYLEEVLRFHKIKNKI